MICIFQLLQGPSPAILTNRDRGTETQLVSAKCACGKKHDEIEMNVWQLWGNNWRQFTSVLPGLLLLLTAGVHIVFTIYELDHFSSSHSLRPFLCTKKDYDYGGNGYSTYGRYECAVSQYRSNRYPSPSCNYNHNDVTGLSNRNDDHITDGYFTSFIVIMMWFVGAIVGNISGAALIRKLEKRTIYVSFHFEEYT